MQCGCSRSRFASLIFSEIRYANISKTDVGELRGRALLGRLGLIVDLINENTHPLIAAPVSIYSAALFRVVFNSMPSVPAFIAPLPIMQPYQNASTACQSSVKVLGCTFGL